MREGRKKLRACHKMTVRVSRLLKLEATTTTMMVRREREERALAESSAEVRGSLGEVQIRRRTAGRSILDEHENDLLEQAINSNSAAIRDLLLGRLLESFCYQVVDQSRRCGVL